MQQSSVIKNIKSIVGKSLFSGKYAQGICRLQNLEKRSGHKNIFLYSYGILYDHLAMGATDKRKASLEKSARSYYQEAISKHAGGLNPYWGLGRILLHNKKYAAGLAYYRKAYRMKPESKGAKLSYATALFWAGRLKEAKKLFLIYGKKHGLDFRFFFNMAGIEEKLGNQKQSRAYAVKALHLFKKNKYRRTLFGKSWEKYLKDIAGTSINGSE